MAGAVLGGPEEQVRVQRRLEHALVQQLVGEGGHAGVEDLELGADARVAHALGQRHDRLRRVEAGAVAEVQRAQREAGHVGLLVARERQHVGALVELRVRAAAGRHAEHEAGAPPAQLGEDRAVRVAAPFRLLVGPAGVEVDDGRTGLEAGHGVGDDLLGRDRHVGHALPPRHHAGERRVDDEGRIGAQGVGGYEATRVPAAA